MIKGNIITKRIEAKFAKLAPQILQLIHDTIDTILIKIQTTIKRDKLSGQVLNRRTGNLSRSIHYAREKVASGVRGIVFAGVKYAYPHEYGGDYIIPAHERMSILGNPYRVDSYTAHFKEKSFMRSTLAAYRNAFDAFLRGVVIKVIG